MVSKPATEDRVNELQAELAAAVAEISALQLEMAGLRADVAEVKHWRLGVEAVWPLITSTLEQ